MSDRLKVTAQYLIPKQALTVLAGKLAGARAGGLTAAAFTFELPASSTLKGGRILSRFVLEIAGCAAPACSLCSLACSPGIFFCACSRFPNPSCPWPGIF